MKQSGLACRHAKPAVSVINRDAPDTRLPPDGMGQRKLMKHLSSFNGAIISAFFCFNVDSRMVLDAVNAFVGEVEALPEDVNVKAKAKLTGKLTEKSDKRVVTITESEKRKAKVKHCAQSALYALSTALDELTDRHGVTVGEIELPYEIAEWADRDTWRVKEVREAAEAVKRKANLAKADMEYGIATAETPAK